MKLAVISFTGMGLRDPFSASCAIYYSHVIKILDQKVSKGKLQIRNVLRSQNFKHIFVIFAIYYFEFFTIHYTKRLLDVVNFNAM
jgi:hypothetical protein